MSLVYNAAIYAAYAKTLVAVVSTVIHNIIYEFVKRYSKSNFC